MMPLKQILIVEDNDLNRAILNEILSEQYRVLEAENGLEALSVLEQTDGEISLILLDVMMPVMDGFTFLDRIRDDPELSLIPVIVMTQSNSEEDEVAALAHGATDFVPKPYRPQVILHRVASIIKLRETAAMVNQFQYDRLTGLYSKEFFIQKVRDRLEEDPDREYSLICANVENFKLFNDAYGIPAGDRLLKEIADAYRTLMGEDGICCRYRADRFICLHERNEEYHRRLFTGEDGRYCNIINTKNVVMKWGIYEITDRTVPVERMCDRVLLALESIKGQYHKFYTTYDDALRDKLLREQAITDAMETALQQEQFVVYYQPKYSLVENRLAGAEALVRWVHPEWGFISPGEFIPLFEKNGFIPQLDQYVWERVCAQLRQWQDQGYPLVPVSVNVSRADMYQTNLEKTLLELTQRYGIDPAYLHLEITESAYAENPSQIISTVAKLWKEGFTIEMDDFGSGYSSLSMLGQMTMDILKLDMQFVRNEIAKPADQSILNDIINMAHRMHLTVVAEGVETQEQVNRLRMVGCDYVQGYFFAKPMPVADFEALLKEQSARKTDLAVKTQHYEPGLQTLLLVDDEERYCEMVRNAMEGHFRVITVSDEESALDCIRSGDSDVSAVIMSMCLPNNGAENLLHVMRRDPTFWAIPVLATIPNGERRNELPLAMEADDFLCKCHPLADLRRRVQRLMDIAAFRKREDALHDAANRDFLTGLLNRRGLQMAMEALRREELPAAVCLFDLDDLKKTNDTYGHDAGDRILRTFAELLRSQTRAGDIHCRYGGDEFVVILKRLSDSNTVIRKGREICQAFRACLAQENLPNSCSVGIAVCGVDERPSSDLIDRADQALYCAKRENKGGCCVWQPQLQTITQTGEHSRTV